MIKLPIMLHYSTYFKTAFSSLLKLSLCTLFLFSVNLLVGQIMVDIDDVVVCEGESIQLQPNVSGGQAPYSYVWTPSTGLSCTTCADPIAAPLGTTTYNLEVTDDNNDTENVSVTVIVEPVSFTSLNEEICDGEFFEIGGVVYTTSGDYEIVLTSVLTGCDSIVNLTLNVLPTVTTNESLFLCEGETVVVDGTPITEPGVYTFNLVASTGCDSLYILELFINPAMFITIDATEATCGNSDGTAVIVVTGGSPPYTYQWSDGSTTQTLNLVPVGTYCVTITDSFGCLVEGCVVITESADFSIDVSIDGNLNCENQEVELTASPTGGVAPFVYEWRRASTGTILAQSPQIMATIGESYVVLIIDDTGCAQVLTYVVPNPTATPDLPDEIYIDCNTGVATLNANVAEPSPALTYDWTGPNGFSATDSQVDVSEAGTYTVVISDTDATDCLTERTVIVRDFSQEASFDISQEATACNSFELRWPDDVAPGEISFSWSLPNGSTSDNNPLIPTETGIYQLVATDNTTSCTVTSAIFVDLGAEICASIMGQIIVDLDEECDADPDEAGIGGWLVRAQSTEATYFALADMDGNYQFDLPLNTYQVTVITPNAAWELCGNDFVITLDTEGQIEEQDFLAKPVLVCGDVSVDISTNFLRRCFNSFYTVKVCNTGTEAVIAPSILIELDPFLTLQSVNVPYTVAGQSIIANPPDLPVGGCTTFRIFVEVSCDSELGQTHCTTASYLENEYCVADNPEWTGASLNITGVCEDDEVRFIISNEGDGPIDEPVHYIVIEDGVMLMEMPEGIFNLPPMSDTVIVLPANGSTYTIVLDQAGNHPYSTSLVSFVEGCTSSGSSSFTVGVANQFGISTPDPAQDIDCSENIGSYDPNDKLASPSGYGPNHYIFPDQGLDYRIRFQNTGTDTAFTVVIRDTLSPWLDINTLELGASSHDYRTEFQDTRTLVITFDNIRLPDSNVNLEGSNGYVDYSISPMRDIPLETVIENGAGIYFDFNEPVLTPVIFHTVGVDFLPTSTSNIFLEGLQVELFPNPNDGFVNLRLIEAPEGIKTLSWYNAQGQYLGQDQFDGPQWSGLIPAQKDGLYFYQIHLDGRLIANGKLIAQK